MLISRYLRFSVVLMTIKMKTCSFLMFGRKYASVYTFHNHHAFDNTGMIVTYHKINIIKHFLLSDKHSSLCTCRCYSILSLLPTEKLSVFERECMQHTVLRCCNLHTLNTPCHNYDEPGFIILLISTIIKYSAHY